MSDEAKMNRIGIRVNDDVKNRLDSLSELMGIPVSTLCRVAISNYLVSEEVKLGSAERIENAVKQVIEQQLTEQN